MKTIVRRRWIKDGEAFVEVSYRPADENVAIKVFTRDPRKRQYHKPKYWTRSYSMCFSIAGAFGVCQINQHITGYRIAREILQDDLRLTSSVSRALVA